MIDRMEVLFIDARKQGYMVDRVLRAFTHKFTAQIVSTFPAWERRVILSNEVSGKALAAGESPDESTTGYRDIPGFCKSENSDEVTEHAYVPTPDHYVGAEEVEDDGVPFAEKIEGLTRVLATQFHESEKLRDQVLSTNDADKNHELAVSKFRFTPYLKLDEIEAEQVLGVGGSSQ